MSPLSKRLALVTAPFALAVAAGAASQAEQVPGQSLAYADLVDLSLAAPVVARVTIARADRIKGAEAPGLSADKARFYVTATVGALIRGAAGLSPQVTYLVDVPLDERGRAPRLKGAAALVFARPVAGRPAELRLIAPDAEIADDPATEQTVHAILTEALGTSAPPRITGVGNVFHVPGSLPGESETTIFLRTADGRPVSLAVQRRPGERPHWAVALSDMIDDAAKPPQNGTLLWYELACGLPRELPAASVGSLSPEDADAVRADYRVVLDGLGGCGRRRGPAADQAASLPGGNDESVTPTAAQSG